MQVKKATFRLDMEQQTGSQSEKEYQYSCLENPMDRGAWRATVHGVAKSQTQLSDFTIGEENYLREASLY